MQKKHAEVGFRGSTCGGNCSSLMETTATTTGRTVHSIAHTIHTHYIPYGCCSAASQASRQAAAHICSRILCFFFSLHRKRKCRGNVIMEHAWLLEYSKAIPAYPVGTDNFPWKSRRAAKIIKYKYKYMYGGPVCAIPRACMNLCMQYEVGICMQFPPSSPNVRECVPHRKLNCARTEYASCFQKVASQLSWPRMV